MPNVKGRETACRCIQIRSPHGGAMAKTKDAEPEGAKPPGAARDPPGRRLPEKAPGAFSVRDAAGASATVSTSCGRPFGLCLAAKLQ